MSRSADEQARRLLWLFPRWVRADRGEEALGVVLDQVPPGADRLPVRSRFDLVRAGLHARRRSTPPPSVWIDVVMADARNRRGLVPDAWRTWLIDWLRDARWRRRYAASTTLGVLAVLVLTWPIASWDSGAGSFAMNVVLWGAVLALMQYTRAPRWRWLIALRNGMVPSDLRPFDRGATTIGVVRPLLKDREALALAALAGVVASALLGVNLVVSAVADPVGTVGARSAAGAGAAVTIALVQVAIVLVLLVLPVLRRVGRIDGSRPSPPDPALMVDRARSAPSRAGWTFTAVGLLALGAWSAAIQGAAGAVVLSGLALAAWAEVVVIVRRQRRLGRPLTMWEVWPASGPQPYLLVRQDLLEAEGLNGPMARTSRPPKSPA